MEVKKIAFTCLWLICLIMVSCAPASNFDRHLSSIVEPYHFSITKWESGVIFDEAKQWIFGEREKIEDEVYAVTQYFSFVEQIKDIESEIEVIKSGSEPDAITSFEAELNRLREQKASLEDVVEKTIERQIRESLSQQGIFNPLDKYLRLRVGFPPLNFKLDKVPYLLVVSPRDRIESIREITLLPDINQEGIEKIEVEVDRLDVSSLVVGLGGIATYPSFVTNEASLRFTIDTATEEWLHQYLVFQPLGFLYLLDLAGISRNYEIATMNETLVGIVSKEIGAMVYEQYYSQPGNNDNQDQAGKPEFDFNGEMRDIRRAVDKYLARGEIEQAEEFMEQKRQYLVSKGYHIRKLNQAYFAFHGAYADRPFSISPIGIQLKELRSQSTSLSDFLNIVASMTSPQDLSESLE